MITVPPTPAVSVDRACYYRTDARSGSSDVVTVTASGLTPGSPYSVRIRGHELVRKSGAPATTDVTGGLTVRVRTPHIGLAERTLRLTVRTGSTSASTPVRVTAFDAFVRPVSGDPRRAVRVGLLGWQGRTVYLHYLTPKTHRVRRTVSLGRTAGACGHATVRLKHLYPFHPRAGTWRLRFDTHRRYVTSSTFFVEILSTVSAF